MYLAYNPAPIAATDPANPSMDNLPLDLVHLFILNETEAEGLSGQSVLNEIKISLAKRFPYASFIITLGAQGVIFFDQHQDLHVPAQTVQAIDTTAAGDTFIGFFLHEFTKSINLQTNQKPNQKPSQAETLNALTIGCQAAALCIQRAGAAVSIPDMQEVQRELQPLMVTTIKTHSYLAGV